MLSLGKIQELVDWEEADSVVSKMTLMDKTAIPIDLLSSTERKAVLVLKQHEFVTVDNKDLEAMHSLTQLDVRTQTDTGDWRDTAAAVARTVKKRLAGGRIFELRGGSRRDHQKPATFFISPL
jgi:hypothetical protein